MYHINREFVAHTVIKQIIIEFGYIFKNGGQIKYKEDDTLTLDDWQMSFRHDPTLDCEVTLHRQYIEAIDIHPDETLLRRFEPAHKTFLAPYFTAIKKAVSFERLDYHPFLTQDGRVILAEIKEVNRRRRRLTDSLVHRFLTMVMKLITVSLQQMESLVYPRLFEQQKECCSSLSVTRLAVLIRVQTLCR